MLKKPERLSARLDKDTQIKADYLLGLGYGPTELVREGIDLLYQKTINVQLPSIPSLLKSLAKSNAQGPADLSVNHKDYYKELLIAKRIG